MDTLLPVNEVGLPNGLSNDEELVVVGDRNGAVGVGADDET
jgi:hypothetical protein